MKQTLAILIAGTLFLNMVSCNKLEDFGTINNDPSVTTEASTAGLLTNVLAGIGGWSVSTRPGLYAQYFSETQYTEASRYSSAQIEFAGNYSGALYDLQNIINLNSGEKAAAQVKNGSNANQIAIARILKAYIFWHITDAWGDIPYSQALQGVRPDYDTQENIYKSLIAELKAAADQFDGGAAVKGDILYGGNAAKWKKFANSVRLIMALRTSKVDAAYAQAQVVDAVSASSGHILTNADNAVLDYPGGNFNNPWWATYNGRTDYGVASTIMDVLKGSGDKRLSAYASSELGFPYGLVREDAVAYGNANPTFARILASSYRSQNSDITILSSSVVKLCLAEARQRGWISAGTVEGFYNDAIKDSWEQWGVYNSTDYNAYIAGSSVKFGAADQLAKIGNQRWLATYPNGYQAWFEWRR
ncbi:MAG: SusD/RagB family nutrient-binding outer membrane lipoprotein, partial [Chitinophagaceae bacterium]